MDFVQKGTGDARAAGVGSYRASARPMARLLAFEAHIAAAASATAAAAAAAAAAGNGAAALAAGLVGAITRPVACGHARGVGHTSAQREAADGALCGRLRSGHEPLHPPT
eukprot:3958210-Prymnesium_polylepis.1